MISETAAATVAETAAVAEAATVAEAAVPEAAAIKEAAVAEAIAETAITERRVEEATITETTTAVTETSDAGEVDKLSMGRTSRADNVSRFQFGSPRLDIEIGRVQVDRCFGDIGQ